jgi:hypothetical protein
VPLFAGLSVAAGIVLLVPTAQAADSQSLHPVAHTQVQPGAPAGLPADAQSGTGLVPLSTESASVLAAPAAVRAFAGHGARDAVAIRDVALPASGSSVPVAPDPANPLAAALLLIFGGGVVFAVSRARTVGGYRGGHHL